MAQAQKEKPIDPKVSEVLEKYRFLFNAPESMPPTRAIAHQIRLFDEASLPPKKHQYYLTQEVLQAVRDNIDLCL